LHAAENQKRADQPPPKPSKSAVAPKHSEPQTAFNSQQQVAKLKEAYKPLNNQVQEPAPRPAASIENQLEQIEAKHAVDLKKSPYLETFKRQQQQQNQMPLTAGSSIVLKSTENQSADCTDFLANSFTLKLKQSVPSLFKQNHSRAGLSAAIQSEESVSYRQQQQQQHHVELLSCKQNETELNNKSPVVCSKLVLKSNVEADEGVLNPKSCTESTGLNRKSQF